MKHVPLFFFKCIKAILIDNFIVLKMIHDGDMKNIRRNLIVIQ